MLFENCKSDLITYLPKDLQKSPLAFKFKLFAMPNKLLCELVPSSFFSFFFFWRQRSSFYFLIFIYLGVPGLSCSMQDLFLVEVCWIFGCGIQILSCGLWDLVL